MHPLSHYDQMIRAGRQAEVAAELSRILPTARLGVDQAEVAAALCRRVELHRLGLRLLRPWVRPPVRQVHKPTVGSRVEYAALLIQLQLIPEARQLLQSDDLAQQPQAQRWLALSYLYDFQLEEAQTRIRKVLEEFSFDRYDKLILGVNLLIAELAGLENPRDLPGYLDHLRKVKREAREQRAEALLRILDSVGQQAVFFSNAVARVLPVGVDVPQDYWEYYSTLVASLHEVRARRRSRSWLRSRLARLRKLAWQKGWFEGVLELDFHQARLFEPNQLAYVRSGSHWRFYQSRFVPFDPKSRVVCVDRHQGRGAPDPSALRIVRDLPAGKYLRSALEILARERYLPVTPIQVWSFATGGEPYLEPYASDSVHQWIRRLKRWIHKEGLPASICWEGAGYRLQAEKPMEFCFQSPSDSLREYTRNCTFSLRDVREAWPGITDRERQYRLQTILRAGGLVREGAARSTRYRWL